MKEYHFEYTKQGIAYMLLLLSFAIIVLGIIALSHVLTNRLLLDILLSIAFAIAFFLFNKHRIKKIGGAELSETSMVLNLSEGINIAFNELKYFYIYDGKNGIVFTLGFLDGTKLKIGANNNFCDIEPFRILLTDFQTSIERYKAQHQVKIIHLESILARKNTIYVLIFITILLTLGFIFTTMPVMIIPIGFTLPMLFNWIQYFQLKQNNKLVDF
ncbi:MAG: hypothetical protein NVSMB24_31040 [Mucilaginibacter sp.]